MQAADRDSVRRLLFSEKTAAVSAGRSERVRSTAIASDAPDHRAGKIGIRSAARRDPLRDAARSSTGHHPEKSAHRCRPELRISHSSGTRSGIRPEAVPAITRRNPRTGASPNSGSAAHPGPAPGCGPKQYRPSHGEIRAPVQIRTPDQPPVRDPPRDAARPPAGKKAGTPNEKSPLPELIPAGVKPLQSDRSEGRRSPGSPHGEPHGAYSSSTSFILW